MNNEELAMMLDADLAKIYQVETKVLNQAVFSFLSALELVIMY